MSGRHILVTGAAGFIGAHVAADQLRRGHRVRMLDLKDQELGQLRKSFGENVEMLVGDISDDTIRRKAVADIDTVIHLASAHLEKGQPDDYYERINVDTVKNLLQSCCDANVIRFVQVSSCGIYGSLAKSPGDEESPVNPDVVYERTKLAGERAALEFWERTGFPVVVLRPVWVYGPGCPRTERLFEMISAGRFAMVGAGKNLRSSIYIADFVTAVDACSTVPGIEGEAFIATHPEQVTVQQIVAEIARLTDTPHRLKRIPMWAGELLAGVVEAAWKGVGRTPPVTRRSLKFFQNDAGFSGAKAMTMLDFQPQFDLAAGMAATHRLWAGDGAREQVSDVSRTAADQ